MTLGVAIPTSVLGLYAQMATSLPSNAVVSHTSAGPTITTRTRHSIIMSLRIAVLAGLMVIDAALATNTICRWTVNNILVDTITSPLADTLTLFVTGVYLGGEEIARKIMFLGDVVSRGYLTRDQINFGPEFPSPGLEEHQHYMVFGQYSRHKSCLHTGPAKHL
ncbi:hypothetical protein E4T38_08926 [Aureobasidium subglaciale]|nr:hypothetical protein E4T38_08926 [Aureobasidium subglaciale]KAI5214588.1 hypothetical protein E4T40_08928 [Aureobasidium subglaciale]KAI5217377.1 hypothetical protein E4T41_08887 [Aureobasidium subglaciale]KAI5255039.1 hypothetical protein E4T46_08921 [Aureobasidium subglaciale]